MNYTVTYPREKHVIILTVNEMLSTQGTGSPVGTEGRMHIVDYAFKIYSSVIKTYAYEHRAYYTEGVQTAKLL